MYLADLTPAFVKVGYGTLGLRGSLGYDGLRLQVGGRGYGQALSAHAPSAITFEMGGRFASFRSLVAMNDDANGARADFSAFADGDEVASVCNVAVKEAPRAISADVAGASHLTLVVNCQRWEYCHSLWLDPELSMEPATATPHKITDCLSRAEITLPRQLPPAECCIATVASRGYGALLNNLLASIRMNANCPDALLAVFLADPDWECERVIRQHQAVPIPIRSLARKNQTIKAVLYSVARVVNARRFLCLDADTLVLGDLRPIFSALDACEAGSILVCCDSFVRNNNLLEALCTHYQGQPADLSALLGMSGAEGSYRFLVNDGVFAGGKSALRRLDATVRAMSGVAGWVDQFQNHGWRNQFVFNLALAHLDCGVEMSPVYNVQLHMNDVELRRDNGRVQALWQGRPARILHFCGWGRDKYPELQGEFASASKGALA